MTGELIGLRQTIINSCRLPSAEQTATIFAGEAGRAKFSRSARVRSWRKVTKTFLLQHGWTPKSFIWYWDARRRTDSNAFLRTIQLKRPLSLVILGRNSSFGETARPTAVTEDP